MKNYYVEVEETIKYILFVEARDKTGALRQGAFDYSVMNNFEKSRAVLREFKCLDAYEVD